MTSPLNGFMDSLACFICSQSVVFKDEKTNDNNINRLKNFHNGFFLPRII